MSNQPQQAAAHIEAALKHFQAAEIFWQADVGGRKELLHLIERIVTMLDESGPISGKP